MRRELFFADLRRQRPGGGQAAQRLQDVPATAVVRGDAQRQPAVFRREPLALLDQQADLRIEAPDVAHHLEADAVAMHALELAGERGLEELHQQRHLLGRPAPVLGAEGEQRQIFNAAFGAVLHRDAHRFEAAAVAGNARQHAAACPAPVAIEDDGDVARHVAVRRNLLRRAGVLHTAISSFSFSCSSRSMSAMCLSVIFCTSSCARRSSFSETSCFLSASFKWWMASRRRLRTATRAFSASWRTTLISSFLRSSVSAGIGTRTVSPEAAGFRPRSESRIAFSIACAIFFSKGVTPMVRASISVTLATWLIGVGVP